MAKRKRRRRYSGPDLTAAAEVMPGDMLTLVAGDYDERGASTATYRGAPVALQGAIAGETVEAEVVRVFPERIVARTTQVIESDAARVEPPCRYFGVCSGCQWQHLAYERQLELKRQIVQAALVKHSETASTPVDATVPSPAELGYRNHARFTVGRRDDAGCSGFVNADTRRFLRIDECLIMDAGINRTLATLQGRLTNMTQWSVRVGSHTGDQIVQPLLPADIHDVESGRQRYAERIGDVEFEVAASSFFQVNSHLIPALTATILEMVRPDGTQTLVDLYCGVGTFACLLAGDFRRVVGIEESASAIANARRNAEPFANVEFVETRAAELAAELAERGLTADVLIVDPPRIGCDAETLAAIVEVAPRQVVMVSCEPATFARDLAALCGDGFRLERVQPLDMFPQTRHVEAVALLVRD